MKLRNLFEMDNQLRDAERRERMDGSSPGKLLLQRMRAGLSPEIVQALAGLGYSAAREFFPKIAVNRFIDGYYLRFLSKTDFYRFIMDCIAHATAGNEFAEARPFIAEMLSAIRAGAMIRADLLSDINRTVPVSNLGSWVDWMLRDLYSISDFNSSSMVDMDLDRVGVLIYNVYRALHEYGGSDEPLLWPAQRLCQYLLGEV